MSERTVIGGTSYESIGSSTSNLLLKCNGTARIQWGNKLIDLIKNGKIASESSEELIFIISDESEITKNGIYVLNKENEDSKLIVYKNELKYELTKTDLYISASNKLDITVELQKLALENIGMYYETLEEVQLAGIQNGIVYITSTKELYTIKDGNIAEFEAKLKTITVEENDNIEEIIDSTARIVLSLSNDKYFELEDDIIKAHKNIVVAANCKIISEGASSVSGFTIRNDDRGSTLEIDNITVRNGLPVIPKYTELTYEDLLTHMSNGTLEPLEWYVITNFINYWRIDSGGTNPRPLLVRAITKSAINQKGFLFNDTSVSVWYDPYKTITFTRDTNIPEDDKVYYTSRGLITWVRDGNGNEANFDFLDYKDVDGKALATLHQPNSYSQLERTIFPKNSKNNILIAHDLKGTVVTESSFLDPSLGYAIDFCIDDSISEDKMDELKYESDRRDEEDKKPTMDMQNNYIECRGLLVLSTCTELLNNRINNINPLTIEQNIYNSKFENIDNCTFKGTINDFQAISVKDCVFNCAFDHFQAKGLTSCTFNNGILKNISCKTDISNYTWDSTNYKSLYDTNTFKELYVNNSTLTITVNGDVFDKGMIMMINKSLEIPQGWAICNGENGTPDLGYKTPSFSTEKYVYIIKL